MYQEEKKAQLESIARSQHEVWNPICDQIVSSA